MAEGIYIFIDWFNTFWFRQIAVASDFLTAMFQLIDNRYNHGIQRERGRVQHDAFSLLTQYLGFNLSISYRPEQLTRVEKVTTQ